MKAFLDDYGIITAIVPKEKINGLMMFSLSHDKQIEELEILYTKEYNGSIIYTLKYTCSLQLWKKYRVSAGVGLSANLDSGSIIRSPRFDEEYYYDGALGIDYSKKRTIFRIWSPVCSKVTVVLNEEEKYDLTYIDKGLWLLVLDGDHEGKKYHYVVDNNSKKKRILDPYGIASDTNGKNNYIVDINQFRKHKYPKPFFSGDYVDASIYEASVRDMSFHTSAKARHKGKFIGMLENHPTDSGLPTGLDYVKYLGFSHIQLMPTYDFDGVDDTSNKKYNWGYNPHQYFVPCGWYTTDPEHPYTRINEFIQLIDGAHKRDLRVVLDVVFNHVYDYLVFPLEALVPGYFYRVDGTGKMTEVTGCQNDFATEKKMARKLIVDNLVYLAKVYKVDGFRFDLMGLLDVDTMNEISKKLNEIDDKIILYGEGWNMSNTLPDNMRPNMFNHHRIPTYAFFNDSYRDFLRGSQWHHTLGYTLNCNHNMHELYNLLCGSCVNNYKFFSPNQTINYVECHDNYTYFDFVKTNSNCSLEQIKSSAKLALSLVLISQGIPFIHSGQEFLRTKNNVENSYNKGDVVNQFDYYRRDEHLEFVNLVKDLLTIRKEEAGLRFNNAYDIMKNVYFEEIIAHTNTCKLRNNHSKLLILIKNNSIEEKVAIQENYNLIFDGWKKVDSVYQPVYKISEPGVYIFKKEA